MLVAFNKMVDKIKNTNKSKKDSKIKDWRVLEFFVPIEEASSMGNDFFIKGTAINETTTRNGIKYIASELEKAAPSFRSKPILLDHKNEILSVVGRTTENVNWNDLKRGIEFEAKIMDERIQSMINDGRITDVSIGAKVENLEENKDEGTVTAYGLEGLEISLVAVPGDPGANLASAMATSFEVKESLKAEEEAEKEPEKVVAPEEKPSVTDEPEKKDNKEVEKSERFELNIHIN